MSLRIHKVASVFGVSPDTIRRWADTGILRFYRLPSGERRFHEDDVLLFGEFWFPETPVQIPQACGGNHE
ncbi:MAG TPA: helix-turn-helix domain-containing protein [Alphaproteobacteria bacterium]|nr:helix-turn-helix domain-containing protein [Alphaproteobacteria bacterium]